MKKIIFLLLLLTFATSNVYATLSEGERVACEKLLQLAEKKQLDKVYELCAFDDEGVAWYRWAPQMSAEENKKALYELCRRFPTHDYAHLYCQKSADLDYIPAFYWLSKEADSKNEKGLAQNYLERIIEENDIKDKKRLVDEKDFVARQAYEDLAKIYLNSKEQKEHEKGLKYLQIAADAGSASAAHTLGVLLYWNSDETQQAFSKKYLWKAILSGCPAAEENLGLMRYLEQGHLYLNDAKEAIESRLFSCKATDPEQLSKKKFLKVEDCPCSDVLDWFKRQQKKPFLISNMYDRTAVLRAPNNQEYTVQKGDKIVDGFVVEDIRSSAVIVRRIPNERYVIYYRPDAQCVDLCVNPNVIPKRLVKQLPPYELEFTDEECQNLAASIEDLNNPMTPFRGLPECQLQDWQKWGQLALDNKRNKHLFLLANYKESDYIPSYGVRAEYLINEGVAQNATMIEDLLKKAMESNEVDELSAIKKEQAYCLLTKVYMDAKLYQKAFELAKAGSDKKYPQSTNMLAILYAKGRGGVKKNVQKAEELFLQADEYSAVPFFSARQNYQALKSGKGDFVYGECQDIGSPQNISVEKLLELY